MPTKGLLSSKTFWSDVCTIAVAVAMLSDHYFGTHIANSPLWGYALTLLGALGIYGRKTADMSISGLI